MKIPSNRQWTQDNSGDTLGILGSTTNMAMDTMGKAILAHKAVDIYDSSDDADMGYPIAIDYFDDQYYVLTDVTPHSGNFPTNNFDSLATAPTIELWSDATVFNSLYWVTTNTSIYTTANGVTWTDRSVALTAGVPHPMCVFESEMKVAVGNGNTVKLVDTSYTVTDTLTIPTQYQVTTIRSVGSYLFVGTKNLNGGNAFIFVWDGSGTAMQYKVEVGASWVFSMTPYLSTVAAITSEGQLGIVNGTTFQELAGLPVYYEPHARWQGAGGLTLNGKVFNRGMCTIGDTIYLNIEGEVDSGFMPEMKSGIWVYDPAIGLYHRGVGSLDHVVQDSSLSRSGDYLTTSAAHQLKTGDCVVFGTVAGLTGVSTFTRYYVKVESTTEIRLAASRKGLKNANYMTLGGTPSSDKLVYVQNSEYLTYYPTSGAISPTIYSETPYLNLTSEIMWGSRVRTTAGTAKYALFTFADSYNVGQFTTQRVYSDNIDQNWKELYNFIDGLTVDTEEVVIKVQSKYEEPSVQLSGVWLDTNTVNNTSASDFALWTDIEVGNEIVFTDGYGRGRTAHVVSIETSSSTVSLTLDESIGTTNGVCSLYYTTFEKVGQALTTDNKFKEKIKSSMEKSSAWVAVKVELRGYGLAVNMMEMSNVRNKSSN